jgi:hypothetical protein
MLAVLGPARSRCSSNSQIDSSITDTTSRCEAAKAGPIGACFSSAIQVKNAPT